MEKNDRKPEIRFSGFETAWQKKCFGDEFDILSNNTLSREFLNYDQGIAKNVHYGDVLIKFNEYLDASKEVLPYIEDEKVIDKFQNSFLRDGDIVIADTAEDETVGKCTEIGQIRDLPIIAGLHTMPCRPKGKYAPKYLGYYLNADAYHRGLLPLMQGVKVTSISRSGVKDTDIIVSEEYDEQKKIGQYLFTLDEKIKFEKDKLDRLIILKKSMLEKMFPQGNSKVPEIRFGKYTDEWEQRKLGEIADKITVKNSELQYVETFTNSAEFGIISQRDFFDHDVTNADNIGGYYIVENESFVYNPRISTSAPVGPINRNKLGRTGVMSPLYTVFRPHDIDNTYLEYFFKSSIWHAYMKFNGDSGARSDRFAIKDSVFFEMPIPLPDIDEQRKIGKYLNEINNLITFHQRKVDKLKNIKSSCMDKMFV